MTHNSAARAPASFSLSSSLQTIGFPYFLSAAMRVGYVVERRVVEVDKQEVGGPGHLVGIAAVSQPGGGDEQARRAFCARRINSTWPRSVRSRGWSKPL